MSAAPAAAFGQSPDVAIPDSKFLPRLVAHVPNIGARRRRQDRKLVRRCI